MKLTMMERIKLLEVLPVQGDILSLKIVRKLRESLSFSEEERGTISVRYEYRCPFQHVADDGKLTVCHNSGFFSAPVKCAEHETLMELTGEMQIVIPPEAEHIEKDVFMGPEALKIASSALKALNDAEPPRLTDAHISLYDKFFPEKVEVPEAIKRAME